MSHTPLVLVVDDDRPLCSLVARVLRDQGFRVLEATSGEEALGLAAGIAGTLDLLVSDLSKDHLSGLGLANVLRERWPGLPTLVLARVEESGEGAASARGPAVFLPKPFNLNEMRALIYHLLIPEAETDATAFEWSENT